MRKIEILQNKKLKLREEINVITNFIKNKRRKYGIVLPQNYVELDEEEIACLYGSYRVSKEVWVPSRNITMSLTKYKIISNTPSILLSTVAGLLLGGSWGAVAGAGISYASLFAPDNSYKYDMVDGKKRRYINSLCTRTLHYCK